MDPDLILRTLSICLALAGTETLHGIARTVWLVPRVGKERAQRVGIATGSLLAFGVCWLLVPGMGLQGPGQHLALGAVLALFMGSFDLALGHWVLRRPWKKALTDFDPRTGNLLVIGLALLLLFPLVVASLRGTV